MLVGVSGAGLGLVGCGHVEVVKVRVMVALHVSPSIASIAL